MEPTRPVGGVESILGRMRSEASGSAFVFRDGAPDGWITAITNQRVAGGDASAVKRALLLARLLAALNPAVADRLVVGWWTSDEGDRYIDVSVVLRSGAEALEVASAFVQRAVALVRGSSVTIVETAT